MKPTELNERQRARLIEKYRDVNVDDSFWYESVYESTKENLALYGFDTSDFAFTGFWSQGDGASFCGYVLDHNKFMKHYFSDESTYPTIRRAFREDVPTTIKLYRTSRQSVHEYCVQCEIDFGEFEPPNNSDDDFVIATVEAWNNQLEAEASEFSADVLDAMRAEMRQLYKDLEEEYNYQSADAQVWDWIVNNLTEIDDDDLELIEEL